MDGGQQGDSSEIATLASKAKSGKLGYVTLLTDPWEG
jgi:hypothetical protein